MVFKWAEDTWNKGKKAVGKHLENVGETIEDGYNYVTGGETRADKRKKESFKDAISIWDELGEGMPLTHDLIPKAHYETTPGYLNLGDPAAANVHLHRGTIGDIHDARRAFENWDNDTLKNMSRQGFTGAEMNMINLQQAQAEQAARGQRESALQALAAQGRLGGSSEMLARLQGAETAANAAAGIGAQAMMGAQQRALGAATNYSSLEQAAQRAAGDIALQRATQQFNEKLSRANARDAARLNNLEWKRNVRSRNVERQNQYERNKAAAYQQDFNNRYNLAGQKASARLGLGNFEGQQGDRFTRSMENQGELIGMLGNIAAKAKGGGVGGAPGGAMGGGR